MRIRLLSGATRNRNLTISSWISLMYLLAKEVISRYCSTGFLQYFAVSCGVDFLLFYKGNALFWNTSRCLVFLLHFIGEPQFKWSILLNILAKWYSIFLIRSIISFVILSANTSQMRINLCCQIWLSVFLFQNTSTKITYLGIFK